MQEHGRIAEQMWRRKEYTMSQDTHTHTQVLTVVSAVSVKCHHLLMAVMTYQSKYTLLAHDYFQRSKTDPNP